MVLHSLTVGWDQCVAVSTKEVFMFSYIGIGSGLHQQLEEMPEQQQDGRQQDVWWTHNSDRGECQSHLGVCILSSAGAGHLL